MSVSLCIRMKCMCECIRVYLSGYKDEVAPFSCHSTVKALCPVFTSSLLPKPEPSFNICIHSHFSQTCTFYQTIFFYDISPCQCLVTIIVSMATSAFQSLFKFCTLLFHFSFFNLLLHISPVSTFTPTFNHNS